MVRKVTKDMLSKPKLVMAVILQLSLTKLPGIKLLFKLFSKEI